jgi:hypothetical protein
MAIIMTNPLTNPDRFFAELSRRDANMWIPAAIVLLAAIATGIYIAAVDGAATPSSSGAAIPFTGISVATSVIGGLIIMSISWLLYAGVFYAISTMLRGVGSFRRVLEFTGYGFIPAIILFLLWSAVIWIFGVKHACDISRRTATVTVVLPVAVYLLYSIIIII